MIKLVFYVHCNGWKNGGYQNTHYFQTEAEARSWAQAKGVKIRSLEIVSQEEFSVDYMGGGY